MHFPGSENVGVAMIVVYGVDRAVEGLKPKESDSDVSVRAERPPDLCRGASNIGTSGVSGIRIHVHVGTMALNSYFAVV